MWLLKFINFNTRCRDGKCIIYLLNIFEYYISRPEDMIRKPRYFLQKARKTNTVLLVSIKITGRLYQVEYAMEAIGHAGMCLGILAQDGVLLAAERKNTNKLLDEVVFSEKIYPLHE